MTLSQGEKRRKMQAKTHVHLRQQTNAHTQLIQTVNQVWQIKSFHLLLYSPEKHPKVSFKQIIVSKIKAWGPFFHVGCNCLISTVAKSEGTTPHSLLLHCLQWNKVKLVWRQLQLPFDHASLNNIKYTLTCAHPLTGATKISHIFVRPPCTHTTETEPIRRYTQTLYSILCT